MEIKILSNANLEDYFTYLEEAVKTGKDEIIADSLNREAVIGRMEDSFFASKRSLMAYENGLVLGRIEYHFYGCLEDGCKMAYVDWVHTLKAHRGKGVARLRFRAFEEDCVNNNIDEYYLLGAENAQAKRFCDAFEKASTKQAKVLRKRFAE